MKSEQKKIEKLGLRIDDLFLDTDALINRYVAAHTRHEISLTEEKEQLKDLFDLVVQKAKALDSNLEKTVLAEQTKHLNAFDVLEAKMLRTEKQQQETVVQQIRTLKEKYFPGNGLQERRDNFLPLYLKHGEHFMQFLHNNLDPLTPTFLVIQES
jgi:bacillithiol synthase